jgi:hypothetical protein
MAVGELPIEEQELQGFNSFLAALDCDDSESSLPKDVLEQIKASTYTIHSSCLLLVHNHLLPQHQIWLLVAATASND